MAETERLRQPFLILPGFPPDTLGYAARTTTSLLLAYLIAFAIQLDTASSAGVCVAILAQPTPGSALAKAAYRTVGTLVGGVVAVVLVAIFPQDRTALLIAFTLWLAFCTFTASLLRDVRAYGAVLSGYTVGIIAVSGIDQPDGVLLSALNRVAAILLGIACVALVNTAFSRAVSFERLVATLRDRFTDASALAQDALAGRDLPAEPAPAKAAAGILSLRTEASYAAAELASGHARRAGASQAIAGLLGMLSATRAIATGLHQAPDADTRHRLDDAAARLATGAAPAPISPLPATAFGAAMAYRANELVEHAGLFHEGLETLVAGRGHTRRVHLPEYRDYVGAAFGALRTSIAVSLGCLFCIYAGWPGATGLLVQQSAFTALLGMQPNPTAAAIGFGMSLPVPALVCGVITFLLLPLAAGVVPFCIVVGATTFVACLAARHPATARFGPNTLLYFTLLLAPSNMESFNFSSYTNNVMVQALAVLFMVIAFWLVFPVSPRRRLARVSNAILRQTRNAMLGTPNRLDRISARCLRVDRLATAQTWLGRLTPSRRAILQHLSLFSEMDSAFRRAQAGMAALGRPLPPPDPDALEATAAALLAEAPGRPADLLHAVSGLQSAAFIMRRMARPLVHYRVLSRARR